MENVKSSRLIFIIDRSGSMQSISHSMEKAIDEILEKQKQDKEVNTYVTQVQFDHEYERVCNNVPVADVKNIRISPRGTTALLDAIAQTVNAFETEYNSMDEKDRPETVLFAIVTDGIENASQKFSRNQVFGIIETVKRDHNWGFTFIGANQDAIGEAGSLGIDRGSALNFDATAKGVANMSRSVGNYVGTYLSTGNARYQDKDKE
jgi:hypothetical protein